MTPHDEPSRPSSPPCLMHELAGDLLPSPQRAQWSAIARFRKEKRAELIARRGAIDAHERRHRSECVIANVAAALDLRAYPVLGIYWPIRGELDLRELARRHIDAGGTAALPVVVAKNEPVEFWQWAPATLLQRGFWNIPVPAERRPVHPDALLIPLVGYDAAGFRLGYGGGYYDRTLAAATPRPFCIGVGYDDAEIATIYPQPHDIPMDVIVTERRVRPMRRLREAAT
jgi:5-formyltetrahydrofolate cyclo-ligase